MRAMVLGGFAAALASVFFFLMQAVAEEDGQPQAPPAGAARAIFAGGCFWCVEEAFDKVEGVISTTSGYTGGAEENPTYDQVSSGETGHAEAVEVIYDPAKVSYERLLYVYWRNVDPVTRDRQFCDRGRQYRSAIFALDEEQLRLAEGSKAELERTGPLNAPIVTEIVLAGAFYPAEEYHQDYHNKNPIRYNFYKTGCGRASRLRELWGDEAGGVQKQS